MYVTKPDVVYDHDKCEFRQFGTTDGKTLLPIYIVGVLLAMLLYIFFYHISKKDLDKSFHFEKTDPYIIKRQSRKMRTKSVDIDDTDFLRQQIQLQTMQRQIDHLINQQLTSQILYNHETMQKKSSDVQHARSSTLPCTSNNANYSVILPNHLSV